MDQIDLHPGHRLLAGAWSYLRAARLLHEDEPQGLAWPTILVNVGLAIELALKGYLREKGYSEKEQVAVGHNLVKAFDASYGLGFRPINGLSKILIGKLNPHYENMSLRYFIGDKIDFVSIEQALNVAEELLFDLRNQAEL